MKKRADSSFFTFFFPHFLVIKTTQQATHSGPAQRINYYNIRSFPVFVAKI